MEDKYKGMSVLNRSLRIPVVVVFMLILALSHWPTIGSSIYANVGYVSLLKCKSDSCRSRTARILAKVVDGQVSSSAYRALGLLDFNLGRLEEAIEWFKTARALYPTDFMAAYWMGKAFEAQGRYTQALLAMKEGGNLDYFKTTVTRYLEAARYEQVIALSRAALELGIESYSAHYSLGKSYLALDELDQATFAFEDAIQVAEDDEGAWSLFELARLIYDSDSKLAENYFNQATCLAPDDAWLWYRIGVFYLEEGNLALATHWANRAAVEFPQDHLVYDLLGRLALTQGDIAGATSYFEIAVGDSTSDANPWTRMRLGEVYLRQGRPDAAVDQFLLAIAQKGDIWGLHFYLAEAYLEQGQCVLAWDAHVRAEELAGTAAQARKVGEQRSRIEASCTD